MEQTKRVEFKKVDYRFVILKSNILREIFKTLLEKFVLLLFENVANIKLLKLFICKINKELL